MSNVGYGGSSYGFDPYGTGGLFALEAAIATSENVVRLYFTETPYVSGLYDPEDGSLASHYAIAPVAGPTGADGNPAIPVSPIFGQVGGDPSSIDVLLDRPMSPFPAQYIVTVTGVVQQGTMAPMNNDPSSTQYPGVYRELAPAQPRSAAPSRDIANPQTLQAIQSATPVVPISLSAATKLLGTYVVDATGDYAVDEGVVSYKKRVLRRGMTSPGGFAFLPKSYGVGIPQHAKKLASMSTRARLAAAWQSQILEEPETKTATVTSFTPAGIPNLVYFVVAATMKSGGQVSFRVPVSIA